MVPFCCCNEPDGCDQNCDMVHLVLCRRPDNTDNYTVALSVLTPPVIMLYLRALVTKTMTLYLRPKLPSLSTIGKEKMQIVSRTQNPARGKQRYECLRGMDMTGSLGKSVALLTHSSGRRVTVYTRSKYTNLLA